MSEASRGLAASEERNKVGPDYFGYFLHEVEQLILQDEDSLPSSSPSSGLSENKCPGIQDKNTVNDYGSSFLHDILPGLSDSKNERLKVLLKESLKLLTSEVDQVLDPVISMCQLQSQIRTKKFMSCNAGPVFGGDEHQLPRKKPKLSSSSETATFAHDGPNNCESFGEAPVSKHGYFKPSDASVANKGISGVDQKICSCFRATRSSQRTIDAKGKVKEHHRCSACRISGEKHGESPLGSKACDDKENEEGDDDLQFLLKNDSLVVEETIKKYSDELSASLGHMEQQLEKLLDKVVSKCRPMSLNEKQQLCKHIQKLPPQNLNRVAEIIQQSRPSEKHYCDEISVNLEKEDNVTLWRLYYYVEAVEKAKRLSASSFSLGHS